MTLCTKLGAAEFDGLSAAPHQQAGEDSARPGPSQQHRRPNTQPDFNPNTNPSTTCFRPPTSRPASRAPVQVPPSSTAAPSSRPPRVMSWQARIRAMTYSVAAKQARGQSRCLATGDDPSLASQLLLIAFCSGCYRGMAKSRRITTQRRWKKVPPQQQPDLGGSRFHAT